MFKKQYITCKIQYFDKKRVLHCYNNQNFNVASHPRVNSADIVLISIVKQQFNLTTIVNLLHSLFDCWIGHFHWFIQQSNILFVTDILLSERKEKNIRKMRFTLVGLTKEQAIFLMNRRTPSAESISTMIRTELLLGILTANFIAVRPKTSMYYI